MSGKLKKVPDTQEGLVQLRRRKLDPNQLYVAVTDVDVNPRSWCLRILRHNGADTRESVRKEIYRLAREIPLGDVGKSNNCSSQIPDCALVNAFELGLIEGGYYPLGFHHLPIESYKHACRDSSRLSEELSEFPD
jgi:hypothetical protein